uniref:LAM_G_DOMAIN domain-containing protein n=1 Tax=Panagrellus redivivus TaxID=6233 RepID=A0A7E4VMS5_PANRE
MHLCRRRRAFRFNCGSPQAFIVQPFKPVYTFGPSSILDFNGSSKLLFRFIPGQLSLYDAHLDDTGLGMYRLATENYSPSTMATYLPFKGLHCHVHG